MRDKTPVGRHAAADRGVPLSGQDPQGRSQRLLEPRQIFCS